MRLIKETNISNVIIFSGMFVITFLMGFSSYYFISKQYDILERGIAQDKEAYILSQRKSIQREVESVIDMINYKRMSNQSNNQRLDHLYQEEVKDWARTIRFGNKKEDYIFLYKIENYQGGDRFAKLVVNPNRPDIEGQYISDEYEDTNGKKFRKIFLKEISENGSSFVDYMYKKPGTNDIRPKVSYFKLYPDWNWVIAAGTYLDDIDVQIAQKKAELKRTVQIEVTSAIIIFLFFSLIANAFTIFLGKQIEKYLHYYNIQVENKTLELKKLNKDLAKRVIEEVHKSREQERLLIEKSKFIALGEMISNIAHQWRQPLSQLSAIIMTLKFKHDFGKLDSDFMHEKSQEAETILEYMSKTIDDFRDFFMPSKEKKEFCVKDAVETVMNIIGTTAKNKKIKIDIQVPENEKVFGHKNEYEQVLLNIITNAKHVLISENIKDPKIMISLEVNETHSCLRIEDNAGGIKVTPIEKVFEPYFTTKEESGGTGIGLYMSKLIIEKSMGGILKVENTQSGAIFVIRLKRLKESL